MIVLLDTNTWISAFLTPRGTPGRVVTLIRLGLLDAVASERLWSELGRAVEYDRVRKALERDGLLEDARRFVQAHPKVALVPSVAPVANWVASDPDDDWVVQCALTAKAERIVTGDKALLELRQVQDVRVVTPRELLDEIGVVVE
jgi:putative PIN family toxin of toxin-antitoxin system